MSAKFQAPFQLSPYHTNSIVTEEDFKSTNSTNHGRFNHHEVRRSAELTLIQKNNLLKQANQITAPFAQVLSAKDRERQTSIKMQWGMKNLSSIGQKKSNKVPPADKNASKKEQDGTGPKPRR
jgi:hypothetical protein